MRFKRKHIEVAAYWRSIKLRGAIAAWPQMDPYYRFGFVIRLLWLGLVLRLGGRPEAAVQAIIRKQNEARQAAWRQNIGRAMDVLAVETDGFDPSLEDVDEFLREW